MKFNLYFDLKGPGGKLVRVPNSHNPVEAVNVHDALIRLTASGLPYLMDNQLGLEVVGVHIERVEDQ